MPRLIEIDNMTGDERDITWTISFPTKEPSKEEVEENKKWREANISNRYGYRVADWSEEVPT